MKKTLIIGTVVLLMLDLVIIFKAPQCIYEIGNGFLAGNALIPTALVLVAFALFARARLASCSKSALLYFAIGACALFVMISFINNTDPVSLFNPEERQYTCAMQEYSFPEYYLKGKTLYSNTEFFTGLPIAVSRIETDFSVPEAKCEHYLQSLENWRQKDWEGNITYWISSDEWETDDVIFCFDCGDNKYMCPQSVYERCIDPEFVPDIDVSGKTVSDEDDNTFPDTIIRHYNNIQRLVVRETFVILVYFVFGLLITICFLPKGKTLLANMLALPIGAGLFALIGYVSLVLHLPYNWISFAVIAVVLLAAFMLTDKRCFIKLKETDHLTCLVGLLLVACLAIVIIHGSVYLPGGDTYSCALIGMNIANDPQYFFTSIDWVASYGLFFSILNSQSYLLGGDYLFAINELMAITAVLLLIYFSYVIVRQKLDRYRALGEGLIALVSLILFLSADFHIHIFYFLANMSVSVWFLIVFGLIILGHENGDFEEYWKIVLICFVMIIQSRIEGGIYVSLFLACFLIDCIEDKYYKRLALFSLLWSLQLNVFQLIYNGNVGNTLFWNPKRGLILLFGLLMPLLLVAFKRSKLAVARFIFDRYYDFFVIFAITGTAALSYIKRSIAFQNVVYFTIHIIENKFFWLMIVAFIPIVMLHKGQRGMRISFTAMVIVGYLCMLFSMFLLRNDGANEVESMKVGMWDSGRRTLFQIMPTAAFLVVYQLVKWLKEEESSSQ